MNLQFNSYNSEKFEILMSDVVDLTDFVEEADVAELLVRNEGKTDHISVKVPTNAKSCANSFLRAGFRLVDTQVEFERMLSQAPTVLIPSGYRIKAFQEQDTSSVQSIARASFGIDRWHSDASLPNEACDEYYAEWVRSCAAGYADEILVAIYDDAPVGFLTLRIVDRTKGRIDLTAVDASHRGKGVYRSLVQSAIRWAYDLGLSDMLATTQINNYGSQRTWIGEGFKSRASWYVLHYSYALDGGCR